MCTLIRLKHQSREEVCPAPSRDIDGATNSQRCRTMLVSFFMVCWLCEMEGTSDLKVIEHTADDGERCPGATKLDRHIVPERRTFVYYFEIL